MKRQKVIIITEYSTSTVRCYGNFKKACDAEGLPYHSLKMKSFPICLDLLRIDKVDFN